jgi:hypothetical protein
MNKLLHWLETNDRLIRIDTVSIQPDQKKDGTLNMRLVLIGIMG